MKETLNTEKKSRLIQKNLSEVLQNHLVDIVKPAIVTITDVKTTPDISISYVHLSILAKDREKVLENINNSKSMIKKYLGLKIANKIRKVPDLKFFIDDSFDQVQRITKLLEENYDDE